MKKLRIIFQLFSDLGFLRQIQMTQLLHLFWLWGPTQGGCNLKLQSQGGIYTTRHCHIHHTMKIRVKIHHLLATPANAPATPPSQSLFIWLNNSNLTKTFFLICDVSEVCESLQNCWTLTWITPHGGGFVSVYLWFLKGDYLCFERVL